MKTKLRSALVVAVLAVAVTTLTLVGCSSRVDKDTGLINGIQVVLHEGCEYLVVENGQRGGNNYSFSLCHKGNCTNVIHRVNHP